MKNYITAMTVVLGVTGAAHASLEEVTNTDEAKAIQAAVGIALDGVGKCYQSTNKLNSSYPGEFLDIIRQSKVFRETKGQPVLVFVFKNEHARRAVINIYTDRSETKILQMQMKAEQVRPSKSINKGTLTKPVIKNLPPEWETDYEFNCKRTEQ